MFVTPGYAQEQAAGEVHSGTEAPHGEGHGGFPPFNPALYPSQLLWLAITFGLFYVFLKRVAVPRIGGILEVRQDRIDQDLGQAARLKQDADDAVAAYEQELAEARNRAHVIGQDARDGAKAHADATRKQVEAGLDQKLADAEAHIASIKSAAMREVGTIAADTAHAIIDRLVGTPVDQAEVAAAVKAAS